jgi:cell division septal protein FtsQ
MARKSKRKQRFINWKAVLATVLVLNVLTGLMYSPLTSIRRMRVIGAQPHDIDRINELTKGLRGIPFLSVKSTKFEGAILASRDVSEAALSHNLFGSAILTLKYRQPVASVVGTPHAYLDDQGVIFASPEPYPELRQLDLGQEYLQPGVAYTLPWPSQQVAELCTKLNTVEELKGDVVHVEATGRLTISGEKGYTVDLGGAEQIDEKLRKLERMLEEDPNLLSNVQTLSLVDPARPAIKAKKS